ncbi:dihydroorotase [Rhabdobacter roseus]|uniref:Dihydroorotase n=1 Tax=Rhabdobacter roseus TaxID=1655419 RepID=A0A840THZ1_9BACT|nr:dihydroorotase [Rhabdobacter roseus]MBB5282565.1 dihydroorotase [Rhabdobacter roseus]
MKLLLRSVRIIDKASPWHNQVKDVLVEHGTIARIGDQLEAETAQVKEGNGWCVSPGWVDMRVASRDPGFEHKEDFRSVREVAARGGFTDVLMLPNSRPVVDSKGTLNYIRQELREQSVQLHVAAAVTRQAEGVDFTEMIDLHRAGAAAFTDGEHPIQNADILLKALLYLRPLNTLLINRPEDRQLTIFGQMNEGVTSTLLGLKGMPHLAEEMMVFRDLQLLAYALEKNDFEPGTEKPLLHLSLLSTARAVEMVREAKKKGLPVSCDMAAHQLAFDDTAIQDFDTNLKVNPPFRTATDQEALRRGLADGTIDVIVSDHSPHDEESKNLEFDHADFGITGLETAFSLALMHTGLAVEEVVAKLTSRPRQILRLPAVSVVEGSAACLTIFEPEAEWTFTRSYSKAKNTPFLGQTLRGRVHGILNQGQARWF